MHDTWRCDSQVAAEFVATFILIFSAAATPIVDQKYGGVEALTGKAVSAAAPVTVMIISMGHISGAHMNPSVTLALALFKHFPLLNVAPYMVAQVLGSISASFALKAIFSPFHSGGVTVPTVSTSQAFFLEFLITFILLLVITATATDPQAVSFIVLFHLSSLFTTKKRRRKTS